MSVTGGRAAATANGELFARLEAAAQSLTAQEQRLAAHMVEHLDRWGYASSSQLADEVGVHRSTIVRFAQKIGFEGYPELQESARAAYLQTVGAHADLVLTEPVHGEDLTLQDLYQRELLNLQRSYSGLDVPTLEATARRMAEARRVLVFGRRFSYPLALHISLVLRTMRDLVECAPAPGGISIDRIFDLTPHDFVLVVSLRRHSAEVQRTLNHLTDNGVPATVLTDASPGRDVPDGIPVLRAFVASTGVLDSYTALVSVSHALLTLVERMLPGAQERLAAAERAWSRFNQ